MSAPHKIAIACPDETDAAPDWWPRQFRVRQHRLRPLLLRHLAKGELSALQLKQHVTAYDPAEVEHALDELRAIGLVRRRWAQVPAHHGSRVSRAVTYFSLAAIPAEAS